MDAVFHILGVVSESREHRNMAVIELSCDLHLRNGKMLDVGTVLYYWWLFRYWAIKYEKASLTDSPQPIVPPKCYLVYVNFGLLTFL